MHRIECGLTCHTACVHLVPDFCGMSLELVAAQRGFKNHMPTGISNRNLRENASGPLSPMKPSDYGRPPSAEAIKAATSSYSIPQSPTAASRENLPPRTSSVEAQKAAEIATGMRPPSQPGPGLFPCSVIRRNLYANKRQILELHNPSNCPFVLITQQCIAM